MQADQTRNPWRYNTFNCLLPWLHPVGPAVNTIVWNRDEDSARFLARTFHLPNSCVGQEARSGRPDRSKTRSSTPEMAWISLENWPRTWKSKEKSMSVESKLKEWWFWPACSAKCILFPPCKHWQWICSSDILICSFNRVHPKSMQVRDFLGFLYNLCVRFSVAIPSTTHRALSGPPAPREALQWSQPPDLHGVASREATPAEIGCRHKGSISLWVKTCQKPGENAKRLQTKLHRMALNPKKKPLINWPTANIV